jgi:hypothetical protein
MHSPETVAFEIYLGRKKKKNGHYRNPFITIWHNDPEKDGTDDSCGWFMRARHGDKEMLKKITSAIERNFDSTFKSDESGTTYYTGYFSPTSGMANMSVQGIVLDMYNRATWEYFNFNRKKQNKFMKNNLYSILHFAENPTDSLRDEILGTFRIGCGEEWKRGYALNHYASIIYGDILRKERKWYQHPKWHIHHWSIDFHPLRNLKRRYWDKCCICGKRGFKSAPYSDWDGTKRWHQECDTNNKVVPNEPR